MKKLLVAVAAVLVSVSAFAQGTVQFNNRLPADGIVAPITRPDGTGAGAGITAELVLIQGANQTVVGTTTFRTDLAAAAGFLNAIDVAVPGVAGGTTANFVIRAYETSAGSYANALAGAGLSGQSGQATATLGGHGSPPAAPGILAGLSGFQLQVVPEPSTIALGVLGAAALLLRRRK